MPDTLEWLVEFVDLDKRTVYEKFKTVNDAIPFLHKVLGNGQRPRLFKETPITLTIDIDPKAPRKRTRKQKESPAPAEPSGGPPLSGSEPPSAGETKVGAASPRAVENAEAPRTSPALPTADPPASPVILIPTGKEEESPKEGAERRPAPSPVSVWDCEVDRYGEDGPCAGPIIFDEVTHGRFCETHMVAVPSGRAEWHRRNGARNRPVARVA